MSLKEDVSVSVTHVIGYCLSHFFTLYFYVFICEFRIISDNDLLMASLHPIFFSYLFFQ